MFFNWEFQILFVVVLDCVLSTKGDRELIDVNNTRADSLSSIHPNEEDRRQKFFSNSSDIKLEHIDFVMVRLQHISKSAPSDIIELKALQEKEMKINPIYRKGWKNAKLAFGNRIKEKLFNHYPKTSIVHKVPEEYHIALTAYTMGDPDVLLYQNFNQKTREVCSGNDIDDYEYKSFFKLLELAIKHLSQEMNLSRKQFVYRGVSTRFDLKVGQQVAFQHFVSTSAQLEIAEAFAFEQTLFEVKGDYENSAIDISTHSVYDEGEVLFTPLQIYQVESVDQSGDYTKVILSSHTPPSDECLSPRADEPGDSNIISLWTVLIGLGGAVGILFGIIGICINFRNKRVKDDKRMLVIEEDADLEMQLEL